MIDSSTYSLRAFSDAAALTLAALTITCASYQIKCTNQLRNLKINCKTMSRRLGHKEGRKKERKD